MVHVLLLPLSLSLALGAAAPSRVAAPDSARTDDDIRQVALHHAAEIQQCYETRGLKVNPSLVGTVEVEVKVLPSGRVDGASVTASALVGPGRDEVEACITTVVRNWRFERGPYSVETIVYPFNLVRDRAKVLTTASR